MFDNVKSLVFSGGAFSTETTLSLFSKQNHRICLIYGRNGTGKSTISRAFAKISGTNTDGISEAYLLDDAGNKIQFSSTSRHKGIFVFNEDYIQNKVRLKEDGLGTIVMFGKQAELELLIDKAQKEYNNALQDRKNEDAKLESFNDPSSVSSPDYYLNEMKSALTGDNNWADRERVIKDSKKNASVNEKTYLSIIQEKTNKSKAEIQNEYQQKYELLCAARRGNAKITTAVNININIPNNEETARTLLAKRIEKPDFTEREKYLFSLLDRECDQKLNDMRTVFSNPETNFCPFCLQEITNEYRHSLIESIKKVLSEIVEEHKSKLKKLKIQSLEMDYLPFQKLDGSIIEQCKITQNEVNDAIEEFNQALDRKINNPYSPIDLNALNINEKAAAFVNALKKLEEARKNYNLPLDDIQKLIEDLHLLNKQLAFHEIKDIYHAYEKHKEEKEKAQKVLEGKIKSEDEKKKILDNLNQELKGVKIAITLINNSLKYVFFSKNRLLVETDANDSIYKLRSNGTNVKPSNISAGERNILALCYFFTEILENTDADKEFSQESMVVIDDPISSFDHENRIGIMSLLRRNIEKLLIGNSNSRIIIMTHDLQAFFDIKTAIDDINTLFKSRGLSACDFDIYELKNKQLAQFGYKKRHEYSELLAEVYQFGVNGSPKFEQTIGNIMRRTLEAFSTFEYRMGIANISTNDKILDSLKDKKYRNYFRSLMYRLVLNGESHSEEHVRSLNDDNYFTETLTLSEKQRTARDIICFIYLLNPLHVKSHLDDANVENYNSVIDEWCRDIRKFEE